jgi:ferritin-like metal-binding protein YciE
MAGYLTAIGLAERINAEEVVAVLKQTLVEEQAAEKKLRTIAASLMKATALQAGNG